MPQTKHLICVVGPTGIGKTKLGIKLAKHFNTEIISSDSRQFYKELSIGTAVPTSEELAEVKHHFIHHLSIKEAYSVGKFEKEVLQQLNQLFKTNQTAVMVGGSGLYEKVVTQGIDQFPEVNPKIIEELEEELESEGIEKLQLELKEKDSTYFKSIDVQNKQRVLRALSVIRSTQQEFSTFLNQKNKNRKFNSILIGLEADREIIYNRINKRVDMMLEAGLLEEAKRVVKYKNLNSLNTVGYKELFSFFEGEIGYDEAVRLIKRNTRRFAKRQLTWYRKDSRIQWFDYKAPHKEIIQYINHKIQSEINH